MGAGLHAKCVMCLMVAGADKDLSYYYTVRGTPG